MPVENIIANKKHLNNN